MGSALPEAPPSPVDGPLPGPLAIKHIDMNMAEPNTDSSKAGAKTPLATYAAQMVVWLWFESSPPSTSANSPYAGGSPVPEDPFDAHRPRMTPLNPLQFNASPEFTHFVTNILNMTSVSHSVVLVALLYIYRLKSRHVITAGPGSERRPFIASLILANKYLDDNTYTNKTWGELAHIDVHEISRMEHEFLGGLGYCLGVEKEDYLQWRKLLDGFILSRERDARLALRYPQMPPAVFGDDGQNNLWINRAASASPPFFPHDYQAKISPKKRSAVDAFSNEMMRSGDVYEALRLPTRKANFNGLPSAMYPDQFTTYQGLELPTPIQLRHQGSNSSLQRSTSLKRSIAKMPDANRRGSMGHIYGHEMDLRHAAANHQMELSFGGRRSFELGQTHDYYTGHSTLVAPYGPDVPNMPPPDYLTFYQLAAQPHPGPDGSYRKGVLCYQNPGQLMPDHALPQPQYGYLHTGYEGHVVPGYEGATDAEIAASYHYGYDISPDGYADSFDAGVGFDGCARVEPAQFANAGPPGYAYDPHYQQWISGPGESITAMRYAELAQPRPSFPNGQGQQSSVNHEVWRTKSEWSSPMPGFDHFRK